MKKRLAIINTHPIQYNSPLFQKLSTGRKIDLKVFFTWSQAAKQVEDVEFGKTIKWDLPLLEGYDHTFVENKAEKPGSKSFWGINNPGLIAEIEEWAPDALLVFGWNFKSHLQAMRYFKGKIPVYFRGDSTLLDERNGLKVLMRRLFLRWVYTFIDKAFFVGANNKTYYIKHGLKEKNLVFVPHAVDTNRFAQWNESNEKLLKERKKELGLEGASHVFLYAGKFIEKKNSFLLINAFIKAEFDESVHLVFIGNGNLEREMKAKSVGYRKIHFLPFQNQSEMPLAYRLGDTLVLPSKGPGETWGLAVNEALSCGLNAIVSDKVGCAPDLIMEGMNGFIFKCGAEDDLKMKLKLAIDLPGKGKEVSRQLLKGKYHFDFVCRAIEKELGE